MSAIQKDATSFNPNALPMQMAARYERDIEASLTRVWENVLDWEHLPHLHSSSFSKLELEAAGDWGWRALTTGQPADKAPLTRIELVIDRDKNRYVSRTLEGGLPGMEIWTTLTPKQDDLTHIKVEFHIPHVTATDAAKLGSYMTSLYTTLWDEDEEMMQARQAALEARGADSNEAPLDLGPFDALISRLPFTLTHHDQKVRIIEHEGQVLAFHARCPHRLAPLDGTPVDKDGCITCPWHGYRFDVTKGVSADQHGLSFKYRYKIEKTKTGRALLSRSK